MIAFYISIDSRLVHEPSRNSWPDNEQELGSQAKYVAMNKPSNTAVSLQLSTIHGGP
jgi:hypothetical protein